MNKTKRELIDESSTLSSSRWSLITCVQWGIGLALLVILSYVICYLIGKPLPNEFLSGCTFLISLIIGIPTVGKGVQNYSELKNNYFDKYEVPTKKEEEEIKIVQSKKDLKFEDINLEDIGEGK